MNIVITWPKTRPLNSYIEECARARKAGLQINFRVGARPNVQTGDACYVVYDGFLRGYNTIIEVVHREDVIDPVTGERWRPGLYIVRQARFHPWLDGPFPIKGFQGFRYAHRLGLP